MNTPDAIALLNELAERGIEIEAAGGKVRFGPAGAVDDDLLGRIEALKPALLELLREDPPAPDRVEWKPSRGSSPWAHDARAVIHELCRSLEDWFLVEAARSEANGMRRRDAERAAFGALIFQILVGVDVKTATQRDNHKEPAP